MNRSTRGWLGMALGAALMSAIGHGSIAVADEVTSKGTMLRGKITSLGPGGLVLEPEYGKGQVMIEWEDVEDLRTDGPYQVLYGDERSSQTPLQGYSDGTLRSGTAEIDVKTIHSGQPLGGELLLADRMRSTWRYWDGSFALGLNAQQATTDSTGFVLALRTQRSKAPTRFILGSSYRYGTQKKEDEDRERTLDQLLGLVRGEYDFAPRIYGYLSGDATYDGIQNLSIRGVPKAGLGYVIWEEEPTEDQRNFLQADVGPAWVYERYFGGDNTDYVAVAFGALAGYYLPYGAHFDWSLDYLPAVDDFTGDYLLRSETGLSMPLIGVLAARLSLLDEYDSTPAEDSDQNSLFLTAGLSVGW